MTTHNDIQTFIETLLTKLGVTFERIELVEVAGQQLFEIHTDDSAQLVGNKGATIRAINHIVKKAFDGDDAPRFSIDVNGYQTKRIDELKETARLLADRARSLKYNVEMNPMSSYERMIVHAALTDEPEVTTESQGEGRERRVVIRHTG